ncbi:hypothetical protein G9A89_013361 [Geosiphon pyriformis]|nr:hypothetical protein G9A89_013361 [Geosiphon pyriformis]
MNQSLENVTYLSSWIINGTYPIKYSPNEIIFDILYTWVNGSETRHQELRGFYEKSSPAFNLTLRPSIIPWWKSSSKDKIKTLQSERAYKNNKRYRDFDELRYSIRSVERNLGEFFKKIWIVSMDFEKEPVGQEENLKIVSQNGNWREGQVPQWLNLSWIYPKTGEKRVEMTHHTNIFKNNTNSLPTFNSLAIETQLKNIDGLSDMVIYFNDDLFLLSKLSPADFWTPMYGYVFHTESHLMVKPDFESRYIPSRNTEWYALEYTNSLLSQRFGIRHRAYVSHSTHVLSALILEEISSEWPQEFSKTASHRFRDEGPDVHTMFLFTHYVMEKHRETLLKSFFYYRMDTNQNGYLEWEEREKIIALIGNQTVTGVIRRTLRDSKKVFKRSGIKYSGKTRYSWSAMDGYPYHVTVEKGIFMDYEKAFFKPDNNSPEARECTLEFADCFGSEFNDPNVERVEIDRVFKNVAFKKLECGDCLIHRLVGLSGKRGLKAFLPPENTIIKPKNHSDSYNWLVKNETSIDKSSNQLRNHAISQLLRYTYTIGYTNFEFKTLKFSSDIDRILYSLQDEKPSVLCLNDDIETYSEEKIKRIRHQVKGFLEDTFPWENEYEVNE